MAPAAERSVGSLFIVAPIICLCVCVSGGGGLCVWSLFCNVVLGVLFSFARKSEVVNLL